MERKKLWTALPFFLGFVLMLAGLTARSWMVLLFQQFFPEPTVAGLYGEYWGNRACILLLAAAPAVVLAGFLLSRVGCALRTRGSGKAAPEFSSTEQRREHYLSQLYTREKHRPSVSWPVYALVCSGLIAVFVYGVIYTLLPQKTSALGQDLALYEAGTAPIYTGMLMQVDAPVVDGVKRIPDDYYVYYQGEERYFRCAQSLLTEKNLMQEAYTVSYLPNSITILSITDQAGLVRTDHAEVKLSAPEHSWLYGDLIVPICDQVPGYETLSEDGQRAFDLLYSQVFSSRVASREAKTRSFTLPEPLHKDEFKKVLALYEQSGCLERYPDFMYRTDDGRIVRVAYCQAIYHSGE